MDLKPLVEVEDFAGKSFYPTRRFKVDSGEQKSVYSYKDGAGSYTFNNSVGQYERCIFWQYSHAVLNLWEECFNAPGLLGNRISIHVGDNVVMHCSVWEHCSRAALSQHWGPESDRSSVCILVATSNAVFKLSFHHPSLLREGPDGQQLSIFYQMSELCEQRELVRRPRESRAVTCTAYSLQSRSIFVYSLTNGQLYVVDMPSENVNDVPLQYELSHSGFIQKFWSALVPIRSAGDSISAFCATDLSIVHHQGDASEGGKLLLLALYINCRLRVWDLQKRSCLMDNDLSPDFCLLNSSSILGSGGADHSLNGSLTTGMQQQHSFSTMAWHRLRLCTRVLIPEDEEEVSQLDVLLYLHLITPDRQCDDEMIAIDGDEEVGVFLPMKLQVDRRTTRVSLISTQISSVDNTKNVVDFVPFPAGDRGKLSWFVYQSNVRPMDVSSVHKSVDVASIFCGTHTVTLVCELCDSPLLANDVSGQSVVSNLMTRFQSSGSSFADWLVDESTFSRDAIVEVMLDRMKRLCDVTQHSSQHPLLDNDTRARMLCEAMHTDNIALKATIHLHLDMEKQNEAGEHSTNDVMKQLVQSISELETMLRPVVGVSILGCHPTSTIALHRHHGGVSIMRPMVAMELLSYHIHSISHDNLLASLQSSSTSQMLSGSTQDMNVDISSIEDTLNQLMSHVLTTSSTNTNPISSLSTMSSTHMSHASISKPSVSMSHGIYSAGWHSSLISRWVHSDLRRRLHHALRLLTELQTRCNHLADSVLSRLHHLHCLLITLDWLSTPARMASPPSASAAVDTHVEWIRSTLNSASVNSVHEALSSQGNMNYWQVSNGSRTTSGSILHWFLWVLGHTRRDEWTQSVSESEYCSWGTAIGRMAVEQMSAMNLDLTTSRGRHVTSLLCWHLLLAGKAILVQELHSYLNMQQVFVPELQFCLILSYAISGDVQFAANLTISLTDTIVHRNSDVTRLAELVNVPVGKISPSTDPHLILLRGVLVMKVIDFFTNLGEYNEAVLLGHCALNNFKDHLEGVNSDGDNATSQSNQMLYQQQRLQLHMLIFTLELETRGNALGAFTAILALNDVTSQRSCLLKLISALDARNELHLMLKFSMDSIFKEVSHLLEKKCRSAQYRIISSAWLSHRGENDGATTFLEKDPTRFHRLLISLYQAEDAWKDVAELSFRLVLSLSAQLESQESVWDSPNVVASLQEQQHWLLLAREALTLHHDLLKTNDQPEYFSLKVATPLLAGFAVAFDESDIPSTHEKNSHEVQTCMEEDRQSMYSGFTVTSTRLGKEEEKTRIITGTQLQLCSEWIHGQIAVLRYTSRYGRRSSVLSSCNSPQQLLNALLDVAAYHEAVRVCCFFSLSLDAVIIHLVQHMHTVASDVEISCLLDAFYHLLPGQSVASNCSGSHIRERILQHLLHEVDPSVGQVVGRLNEGWPAPPLQSPGHYHSLALRLWCNNMGGQEVPMQSDGTQGVDVNMVVPTWLVEGVLTRSPKSLLRMYMDVGDWPAATELACDWMSAVMNKDRARSNTVAGPSLMKAVKITFRDMVLADQRILINLPQHDFFKLLLALQHIVETYGVNVHLYRKLLMKMSEYQVEVHAMSSTVAHCN